MAKYNLEDIAFIAPQNELNIKQNKGVNFGNQIAIRQAKKLVANANDEQVKAIIEARKKGEEQYRKEQAAMKKVNNFLDKAPYTTDKPIEASNDLFYLTAPALGLGDYIIGKGTALATKAIGKGVRKLKNKIVAGILNNAPINTRINRPTLAIDNVRGYIKPKTKYSNSLWFRAFEEEGDAIKAADRFNKEDVAPRKRKALSDEGYFITPEEKEILTNNIYRTRKETNDKLEYDPNMPDKYLGLQQGDDIFINPKSRSQLESILVHEGEHKQTGLLKQALNIDGSKRGFIRSKNYTTLNQKIDDIFSINEHTSYTPLEQKTLDNAYTFTDEFLHKHSDISILKEKAATNRQIRSAISADNKNVTGNELDVIIDNMSDKDLLDYIGTINGYGEDFVKQLEKEVNDKGKAYLKTEKGKEWFNSKINNIKTALKYVGGIAPTTFMLEDNN